MRLAGERHGKPVIGGRKTKKKTWNRMTAYVCLVVGVVFQMLIFIFHWRAIHSSWGLFPSELSETSKRHAPSSAGSINDNRLGLGRKCLAIGMITRSSEHRLRQWHRNVFRHTGTRHRFSDQVDIYLKFVMAESRDDNELSLQISKENQKYNDIIVADFQETEECMFLNRCLTRNHESLFRGIQQVCDNEAYVGAYYFKVDNDSVLNYELMARVFLDLPNNSVLAGRMLPNAPSSGYSERLISNSAISFYPVWPHGSFQGYSKDLLHQVLRPENIATILRRDVSYVFPWSDRATGVQLQRAQIKVENKVFLRGQYFMCPSEFNTTAHNDYPCEIYWNSIAFHAGFGLSGEGPDKATKKLDIMMDLFQAQTECFQSMATSRIYANKFRPRDHYFMVDDDFLTKGNFSYWLSYGCASLNHLGEEDIRRYNDMLQIESRKLGPVSGRCASILYRRQLEFFRKKSLKIAPENPKLSANEARLFDFSKGFQNKMAAKVAVDVPDFHNKMHYISQGHLSNSLTYFCPHDCEINGSNVGQCDECNLDEVYLNNYPDVEKAIQQDEFDSPLDHFKEDGHREDRIWNCQRPFVDPSEGTKAGCYKLFSKFIETTTPLVESWPISGAIDFEPDDNSSCNALVVVDGRDHPWMDFVLKNHRRYLGPYWMFYLVGTSKVTDLWRLKYSGPMIEVITLPSEFGDLSNFPEDYSKVLMSKFLWKDSMQCENILVTQVEALMFRHGAEDFFQYDYVGSPMYPQSFPSRVWRLMNAFNDTAVGGDGGFSFRKRSNMLKLISECPVPIPDTQAEDAWASACTMLLDGDLPHPTIANRFGVGSRCEVDVPLGANKMWMNCNEESCAMALLTSRMHRDFFGEESDEYNCPEGEVMYLKMYPDVAQAIDTGRIKSGWVHFNKAGRFEQTRVWRCFDRSHVNRGNCPDGESLYLATYTDVKEDVDKGEWKSGWSHYQDVGYTEGRRWKCYDSSDN
mmetsp:Transcript_13765/g.33177  ORF Transcript_13765/g.33177 Transcript_13765/m.33177 type:complete len:974 (-) Transcript_13765:96-3017(-)